MAAGKPRSPPVDIRALSPARRRPLRRDPGVKRPTAVIDHPHEAGLAVRQDQLSFGQPAALLKKALRPAVPARRRMTLAPPKRRHRRIRCRVASALFPPRLARRRPVTRSGSHLDPGQLWQPVLGADQREDGRLAVGRNPRAEAVLLLVDRLAESFLRSCRFHARRSAFRRAATSVATSAWSKRSIAALCIPRTRASHP